MEQDWSPVSQKEPLDLNCNKGSSLGLQAQETVGIEFSYKSESRKRLGGCSQESAESCQAPASGEATVAASGNSGLISPKSLMSQLCSFLPHYPHCQ